MMPGLDGSGCGVALVLLLMAIAAVVLNLAVLAAVALRRSGWMAPRAPGWTAPKAPTWRTALAIGAVSVLFFVSFLVLRLAARDVLSSWIVALFFLPAGLGLLSVAVAFFGARRAGVRGAGLALPGAILVAGLCACAWVGVTWRAMALRGALWDAVLREEVATAQALLARGAGGEAADRPFLQELLVKSARDVNVELVRALLDAGGDPNGPNMVEGAGERSPLLAAIGADPILRLHPIDPETHARQQLQVVALLLERGANPNSVEGRGTTTPALLAWVAGSDEMLRLLDAKGATDARTIAPRFEELLAAAASGNVGRVGEIVAPYGARFQFDRQGRSPLVVAAENGHLEVVNALLDAFGDSVQCANVDRARAAASRQGDAAITRRLLDVCSYRP